MTATVLYQPITTVARDTVAAALAPWSAPVGRTVPLPMPAQFAIVDRFGGAARTEVSRDVTIGVECFAAEPAVAEDMAEAADYALRALVGTITDGVTIYRVATVADIANLPHPSGRPRYAFSVAIHRRGVAP